MNKTKVKEKVTKMLSKPKKKMKKLLTNKRKGYSKLMVKHETKNKFANECYDEDDLEMDIDLNYDMNTSYNYTADANNSYDPFIENSTISITGGNIGTMMTTSKEIIPTHHHHEHDTATSVTQTYIDDIMDRGISRKTEYCVVPFYLMVCIMSILTTALLTIHEISEIEGMAIIFGFTLIGSIIGMYGVYAWGVFDDILRYLMKQNEQYRENIDRLNSVGEVLQNDVDDINNSVDYLKRDGNTLEEAMNAYDGLKKELQSICDKINKHQDGHQDIMDLLNEFNEQCLNLNTIIKDNEKAHLLSIFYSVRLYDYGIKNCFNKKQYQQFLSHCNSKTREKFEKAGGFKAMDTENKGFIHVQQFELMVHKVLELTIEESQNLLNSSIKIKGNL